MKERCQSNNENRRSLSKMVNKIINFELDKRASKKIKKTSGKFAKQFNQSPEQYLLMQASREADMGDTTMVSNYLFALKRDKLLEEKKEILITAFETKAHMLTSGYTIFPGSQSVSSYKHLANKLRDNE